MPLEKSKLKACDLNKSQAQCLSLLGIDRWFLYPSLSAENVKSSELSKDKKYSTKVPAQNVVFDHDTTKEAITKKSKVNDSINKINALSDLNSEKKEFDNNENIDKSIPDEYYCYFEVRLWDDLFLVADIADINAINSQIKVLDSLLVKMGVSLEPIRKERFKFPILKKSKYNDFHSAVESFIPLFRNFKSNSFILCLGDKAKIFIEQVLMHPLVKSNSRIISSYNLAELIENKSLRHKTWVSVKPIKEYYLYR